MKLRPILLALAAATALVGSTAAKCASDTATTGGIPVTDVAGTVTGRVHYLPEIRVRQGHYVLVDVTAAVYAACRNGQQYPGCVPQ